MTPKVSIIVPVFNMEQYLCKCLDSILAQSLKEIEVIVVNDASTDDSQQIIDKYLREDSRIISITHEENKGLLITRQTGVLAASGEFIGHVDADDYIDPCMYDVMYKKAVEENADIVQCGVARIKNGDEVPHGRQDNKTLVGDDILKGLLTFQVLHSHCSKIVSRSLWLDHYSLFPKDGSLKAEDFLPMAYICFYASKLVAITNPFYKYRYRRNSGSLNRSDHSITNRAYSVAHHVAKLRDFLIREDQLEKFAEGLAHLERNYYLFNAMAPLFSLDNEILIKETLRKIVNFNGWEPLMKWTTKSLKKHNDLSGLKILHQLKDEIIKEKKVLCILPALTKGKGGAENVVIQMAQALTLTGGYNFILLGIDDPDRKPTWVIPGCIDVVVQRLRDGSLERLVNRIKPDLLFCVTSSNGIEHIVTHCSHLGIPLVVQEAASPNRILRLWSEGKNMSLEEATERRNAFMSMVTKIRLVMPGYESSFPEFLRRDIHVFFNAIRHAEQVADVKSRKDKRKKIINIGGLKPHKNIYVLLESFLTLKDEFPMWDLVICGEGLERNKVQSFVEKHGITGRVELPGNIEDIYPVYEGCHLHVITSLEEGNPLAVCESMVHAIPTIGFEDCSGTNRLIKHNQNGLLVSSSDRHNHLVKAMRELMSNDDKRYEFGQQALVDSKVFDPKKIYSEWDKLFSAALEYSHDPDRKLEQRFMEAYRLMDRYMEQTGVSFPEERKHKKKSIVLFSVRNYDSAGGIQLSTTRLANHLVEEGYEVALVPHKEIRREELFYDLDDRVQLDSIPVAARQGNILEYKGELERVIRAHKPDAVAVLLTGYANFYISTLLSSTSIPVLTTERGEPDFLNLSKGIGNRLCDFLFADRIHLLFDGYKSSIGNGLGERVRVIPSPIPVPIEPFASPAEPNADGRYKICYCGRVDYEKDIFTLIRAFQMIHAKYPDWDLEIVGDGPLLEATRSAVHKNLNIRVHFRGQTTPEEVIESYRYANIFAFPSLTEGCPLALREAMSYKVPVIGFSDAGGVNEVLKDGGGILIDDISKEEMTARAEILRTHENTGQMPFTKALKLARELEELINDPDRRERLGEAGHQIVCDRYSIDEIHQQWVGLFEEMITEGKTIHSYPQRIQGLFNRNIQLQNAVKFDLHDQMEKQQALIASLQAELQAANEAFSENKRKFAEVKNSKTFQIGTLVRLAISRPGRNTVMLPVRIWQVLKS